MSKPTSNAAAFNISQMHKPAYMGDTFNVECIALTNVRACAFLEQFDFPVSHRHSRLALVKHYPLKRQR